jgi:hypothetical protein
MLIPSRLPQLVTAKHVRSLLNLNDSFNKQYRIVDANFGEEARHDYTKFAKDAYLRRFYRFFINFNNNIIRNHKISHRKRAIFKHHAMFLT